MKILTMILLTLSLHSIAAPLEDEKPQMECKRIAGAGILNVPDIIRCENKKEVCYISNGNLNCHLKQKQ